MINQIEPVFSHKEPESVFSLFSSGSWLTEFGETSNLERVIAEFLGVKHCAMVPNGTMALTIALKAMGIGDGKYVGVPALTMIATANAVALAGAIPVFYDVTDGLDIDMTKFEWLSAVIYVSLNGRSKNIHKVKELCENSDIKFIEDACQSFGSKHGNEYLGTIGEIGCFSLSPHKIITTGQGGFLVTDNDELYHKIKQLKDFGRVTGGGDDHDAYGINAKFTDLQAVVGLSQMESIKDRVSHKKLIYKRYKESLDGLVTFIDTPSDVTPWFVDIYTDRRDALHDKLLDEGIGTRKMYKPLHKQFYQTGQKLPNADWYSSRGLFLPSSVNLSYETIDYICDTIKRVL